MDPEVQGRIAMDSLENARKDIFFVLLAEQIEDHVDRIKEKYQYLTEPLRQEEYLGK